jgi:hypothetical protein
VIQTTPRQQLSALVNAPPQPGNVLVIDFLGLAENRLSPPSTATGTAATTARPITAWPVTARTAKTRSRPITLRRTFALGRSPALRLFSFLWILAHCISCCFQALVKRRYGTETAYHTGIGSRVS